MRPVLLAAYRQNRVFIGGGPSAVRAGTISTAEAKTNPWVLKNATRQLSGWTSSGMSACIQMLAWADEQSKTNGSDPVYALERSIELISRKGRAA